MKRLKSVTMLGLSAFALAQHPAAHGEAQPIEAAKQHGVKRCLGAVRSMSEQLIKNKSHKSTCVPAAAPDNGAFSCVTAIDAGNGRSGEFLSMMVTPAPDGTCTGEYHHAVTVSASCTTLMMKQPTDWPAIAQGHFSISSFKVPDWENGTVSFLHSDENNCTVIRRQVFKTKAG